MLHGNLAWPYVLPWIANMFDAVRIVLADRIVVIMLGFGALAMCVVPRYDDLLGPCHSLSALFCMVCLPVEREIYHALCVEVSRVHAQFLECWLLVLRVDEKGVRVFATFMHPT